MVFDAEAIQQITEAIGSGFVPQTLDRKALAEDLEDVTLEYKIFETIETFPGEQKLKAIITKVANYTNKVERKLNDNSDIFPYIEKIFEDVAAANPELRDDEFITKNPQPQLLSPEQRARIGVNRAIQGFLWLARVAEAVRQKSEPFFSNEMHTLKNEDTSSAHYLFFGDLLPKVYERHFERNTGISRGVQNGKSGSAGGPYPRFALEVARFIGITKSTGDPYSAETVRAALDKYPDIVKPD